MLTKLFLIRHGETDWNTENRFQGQTETPLNELGRSQAERIANRLNGEGIEVIYSSDQARALETARIVGKKIGVEVIPSEQLREASYGEWEGLTWEEVKEGFPEELERRTADPDDYPPPGGETLRQMQSRVMAELNAIVSKQAGKRILVVCHAGPCNAVVCSVLGVSWIKRTVWKISNASLNIVEIEDGTWRILTLNDMCHLR